MTEKHTLHGSCLCGSVTVTATDVEPSIGACHCAMCRKWSSSPIQTIDCGSDVQMTGEDCIGVFNSSDWAERGFCKNCGSALFYRVKGNNNHFMSAGLFGDLDGFVFDHEVFIDEKPDFYVFAGERRRMSGQEVFDYFSKSTT